MRVISDELHAQLVKILLQDPKVSVFQQLLMAQKAEATDANEITVKDEGKE